MNTRRTIEVRLCFDLVVPTGSGRVAAVVLAMMATGCSTATSGDAPIVAGVTQLTDPAAPSSAAPTSIEAPETSTEPMLTTHVVPTPASTPASTPVSTPASPSELDADLGWISASLGSDVQISASVRTLDGAEIWGLNAHQRLYPASNQKLVVAAGVLELLDSEHRFSTTVSIDADTPGSLFVNAGGDPTMTTARLASLANEVAAATSGSFESLVVDTGRWKTAYRAPGWQDWHIPTYVGPLSAFMLDDNRWNKADDFIAAPDLTNASRFASLLRSAGVAGSLVPQLGPAPRTGTVVAVSASQPAGRLVVSMMRSSDNQTADALVREVDAVGGNPATTSGGLNRIRSALRSSGVSLDGIDGDGSGLSRANLRSASEWTGLLATVTGEPWFTEFESALPVAGRSGTLAARLQGAATAGNVRAKTGTIIGGRSLSGYLTLVSGEEVAFSIVVNGDGSHDMLDEIDRWVEALAAGKLS